MYYGWLIVTGVFVSQLFMMGFFTYAFSLLVVPVQAEFGASRADVMASMTGSAFVGLFVAPVVGTLVDRWSVRSLMIIGSLVFAAALVLLSLSDSIVGFVLVFALLISVANMLLGPITGSAVVSRWFTASRGKALGIAAIGTSVGGMLVPMLVQYSIDAAGWRASLQVLAACIGFLVLPLLLVVMRDRPEEKGLQAEGGAAPGAHPVSGRSWSTGDVLGCVSFWLIGGCLGLLFMVFTSVMSNLAAYASGLGVDGRATATLIGAIAFCGVLGKLIFGYAADRISLRLGLWLALALAGAGIFVLSLEPTYPAMLGAAVVMGLAAGGMLPVWGAMIASVFGLVSYGRVMGLMTPVIGLLVMPGPLIAGAMFDASGSYRLVMQLFVGILVLAGGLLLPLRIPSPEPQR